MHTAASLECAFALRLRAPLPRASKAQRDDAALPFCEVCSVCLPKLGSKLPRHTRWNSVRRRKSKASKQRRNPLLSRGRPPLFVHRRGLAPGRAACSLTWSSPCVCGTMVSVVSVGRGSVVRLCHGLFVSVGRGIHGLCILCLRARPVSVLCACPGPPAPAGVFEPRNCSDSLLSSVQFSIHGPTPRVRCCCGLCLCLCFARQPRRSAKRPPVRAPRSRLSAGALSMCSALRKKKNDRYRYAQRHYIS